MAIARATGGIGSAAVLLALATGASKAGFHPLLWCCESSAAHLICLSLILHASSHATGLTWWTQHPQANVSSCGNTSMCSPNRRQHQGCCASCCNPATVHYVCKCKLRHRLYFARAVAQSHNHKTSVCIYQRSRYPAASLKDGFNNLQMFEAAFCFCC